MFHPGHVVFPVTSGGQRAERELVDDADAVDGVATVRRVDDRHAFHGPPVPSSPRSARRGRHAVGPDRERMQVTVPVDHVAPRGVGQDRDPAGLVVARPVGVAVRLGRERSRPDAEPVDAAEEIDHVAAVAVGHQRDAACCIPSEPVRAAPGRGGLGARGSDLEGVETAEAVERVAARAVGGDPDAARDVPPGPVVATLRLRRRAGATDGERVEAAEAVEGVSAALDRRRGFAEVKVEDRVGQRVPGGAGVESVSDVDVVAPDRDHARVEDAVRREIEGPPGDGGPGRGRHPDELVVPIGQEHGVVVDEHHGAQRRPGARELDVGADRVRRVVVELDLGALAEVQAGTESHARGHRVRALREWLVGLDLEDAGPVALESEHGRVVRSDGAAVPGEDVHGVRERVVDHRAERVGPARAHGRAAAEGKRGGEVALRDRADEVARRLVDLVDAVAAVVGDHQLVVVREVGGALDVEGLGRTPAPRLGADGAQLGQGRMGGLGQPAGARRGGERRRDRGRDERADHHEDPEPAHRAPSPRSPERRNPDD